MSTPPEPSKSAGNLPAVPTEADRLYEFTKLLYDAGWKGTLDALWQGAFKLMLQIESDRKSAVAEAVKTVQSEATHWKAQADRMGPLVEKAQATEAIAAGSLMLVEHLVHGIERAQDKLNGGSVPMARVALGTALAQVDAINPEGFTVISGSDLTALREAVKDKDAEIRRLKEVLDDANSWLQDIIDRRSDCQPFVSEYIEDIKRAAAKVTAALFTTPPSGEEGAP